MARDDNPSGGLFSNCPDFAVGHPVQRDRAAGLGRPVFMVAGFGGVAV